MAVLVWTALAGAAPSKGYVNVGQAQQQQQLKRYAVMVCPYGTCPSRIYAGVRRVGWIANHRR